jgi:hypothetical protein
MTTRLVISMILLGMVACTPALSMTASRPKAEQQSQAAATLSKQQETRQGLPESDSAAIDSARRNPSLEQWKALFELTYDDPGVIDDFLAQVRSTPNRRRTIILETTLSWGCPCPPWVFPFYHDMQKLQYVMVLPSPLLNLDPTDVATPERSYRMTGYFSGAVITGLEWVNQRGKAPPTFPKASKTSPELQEYWAAPGLVFVVESWCYQENTLVDDAKWLRNQGATPCNE